LDSCVRQPLPLSSLHWLTSAEQFTPVQARFSGCSVGDHRPNTGESDRGSPRREAVPRASRIEGTMTSPTAPARLPESSSNWTAGLRRAGPRRLSFPQRHPAPDGSWRAAIRRPHSRGGRALLRERSWHIPRWLDRLLPDITIEPPQDRRAGQRRTPGNRPAPSRSHDRTDGVRQTGDGA